MLGIEQRGDLVFRGVRPELEVEQVPHLLRADPAGDGLPGVEPGAVDAAVDGGDDGHDLLDEGAVERAHGLADLRRVGEHEAEVFKEEREGVNPAVEGFRHRSDCTSWGKTQLSLQHPAGVSLRFRGEEERMCAQSRCAPYESPLNYSSSINPRLQTI